MRIPAARSARCQSVTIGAAMQQPRLIIDDEVRAAKIAVHRKSVAIT